MSDAPSFNYDAVEILGFGKASDERLPVPEPGEIVIRVGAGMLQDLRTCETVVRDNLMWDQEWYNEFPWSCEKLTPASTASGCPYPAATARPSLSSARCCG